MRIRLWSAIGSALTISVGLVVILGLLFTEEVGLPGGFVSITQDVTQVLLQLVTITVALTILIGLLNLLSVHLGRLVRRQKGALYSLVLILSFALVVGSYIADRENSLIILETVQFSVESALAGLVLFALVFGAYRMMQTRVTWSGTLFIVVLLVVLLGALPFSGMDTLQDAREWLLEIPVSAGARGLLIGIALATVVTGVRVLIGVDRSYRE